MTASQAHPMGSRIQDMVHTQSILANIFGPRSFTVQEIQTLASEIYVLESVLQLLSMRMAEMRLMAHRVGGPAGSSSFAPHHYLQHTPGSDLVFGPVIVKDVSFVKIITDGIPTPAQSLFSSMPSVSIEIDFDYAPGSFSGVSIYSGVLSPIALIHMLRDLPIQVFTAMGSLLREVGATFYKGQADISSITPMELGSLIRLQDDQLKQRCELTSQAVLSDGTGIASGEEVARGMSLARSVSSLFLTEITPSISSWLFENSPLGMKTYTLASTQG